MSPQRRVPGAPNITASPDCGCGAILLFDRRHPSVPTCARPVPARAAAVKDGPASGHRVSGAQRP
jgi:hypothetical protein